MSDIQQKAVAKVGEAEGYRPGPVVLGPDRRSTKGKAAVEWAEGPTLDPLLAYEREAQRMQSAGRRRGSHLDPNYVPAYVPYVSPEPIGDPAERMLWLRRELGSTIRVHATGDGSGYPHGAIQRNVEVPPKGREQNRDVRGPHDHVVAHPEIALYWDGEWTGPVSEEKAMRKWHGRQ